MKRMHDNASEAPVPRPVSAQWQWWADHLAWYAWRILLLAIVIGLVGGVITGLTGQSTIKAGPVAEDPCPQPPCLSLDLDRLRLTNLPTVLWLPVYLLALVLSLPSLLAGLWDLVRLRWRDGGQRILLFVGPLLIFVGTEIVPHIVSPCALLPSICETGLEGGVDVAGQWHLLDHMLVGAVPLVTLYWVILRTGCPALLRLHPS